MFFRTSGVTRQRQESLVLAVLLIIVGALCMLLFFSKQIVAPRPAASQSSVDHKGLVDASHSTALPFSEPISLEIPSINVQAQIMTVGKNKDGSMGAPSGADFDKAAWYKYSPAPGQTGSSIIQGHVDYVSKGPGVFFDLGSLKQGDTVTVHRKDGTAVIFTIYKVKAYQKSQFPTDEVYGAADQPSLVLITCGGELDRQTGIYDSNTIAFGALSGSHTSQL